MTKTALQLAAWQAYEAEWRHLADCFQHYSSPDAALGAVQRETSLDYARELDLVYALAWNPTCARAQAKMVMGHGS